jgi:microcystin-dependent protein
MGTPYVGEIRMFGGNFAPAGWMFCDGSLLPISEYETLFQLIGTTYGGDGESTFALPDLRGRVPIHMGSGGGVSYVIGESGGVESVTLTTNQTPSHAHAWLASDGAASSGSPAGNVLAEEQARTFAAYATPAALNAGSVAAAGGSQPHNNVQPYLCISYIISLYGIFPSPT